MLLWPYKLIIGLIALAGTFGAGYRVGQGQKEVQFIEKEKLVQVAGETKVEFRDRIVTVTKTVKSDGTVQETTRTEEKAKDVEHNTKKSTEQVAEEKVQKPSPSTMASRDYSLSIRYRPVSVALWQAPDYRDFEAVIGRRVVGPVWLDIGFGVRNREASIGIRMEF